jgi:hypothetical protein
VSPKLHLLLIILPPPPSLYLRLLLGEIVVFPRMPLNDSAGVERAGWEGHHLSVVKRVSKIVCEPLYIDCCLLTILLHKNQIFREDELILLFLSLS